MRGRSGERPLKGALARLAQDEEAGGTGGEARGGRGLGPQAMISAYDYYRKYAVQSLVQGERLHRAGNIRFQQSGRCPYLQWPGHNAIFVSPRSRERDTDLLRAEAANSR